MARSKANSKKSVKAGRPIKVEYGCGNVFKDIGFPDDEAENLLLRSTLMIALKQEVLSRGWSQIEAAKALDVPQPRISELMNGRIERFSVEKLISYLAVLGKRVNVTITESKVA